MAVYVNIVGRLGRNAEIIDGQRGQFVSFSLATDDYRKGERTTTWLRVNYNNVSLAKWLKKGCMVNVIGTETVRTYTDRDNNIQISRDVNASSVEFVYIGSGQTQSDGSSTSTTAKKGETKPSAPITTGTLKAPKAKPLPTPPSSNDNVDDDNDLPF